MKKRDSAAIFSEKNFMLLGILDEAYDLYLECRDLVETEYDRKRAERPEATIWPEKYNALCKKAVGRFIDRHIRLFSFRYHRMYVNDEAMRALDMWDRKRTGPLRLHIRIISFRVFLENLERIVIMACLGRERKEKPKLPIESVETEVKNHILLQVRQCEEANASGPKEGSDSEVVHTIWVYGSTQTMSCLQEEHPLQFRAARILALEVPSYVEVVVRYCEECDRYFISEQTLTAFETEYGIMLTRKIRCKNRIENGDDEYFSFCNESELHSRGYNVKADGMSEAVRRKFLVDLITKEVMPVESIIRDIEKAIKIFAGRETFFAAVKKWKSDLVFVNEYCKRGAPICGELKARNRNAQL